MQKLIIEGKKEDCEVVMANLVGYSDSKRVSDTKYIYSFPTTKDVLKALIYCWNRLQPSADIHDGFSADNKMLFYNLSCSYIDD